MPLTMNSVAGVLKHQTREQHRAAESILIPKLSQLRSLKDYAHLLKTYYGFYFPLQSRLASFIPERALPDIQERKLAHLILKDLASMGEEISFLPLCSDLPTISATPHAFGVLYVLEGSTLGGRMISQMLLRNEGLSLSENQLRFFNGYGEHTGSKWKTLLTVLEQEPDVSEMVAAANQTFSLFHHWIKHSLYGGSKE